jgi:hypothetical protein
MVGIREIEQVLAVSPTSFGRRILVSTDRWKEPSGGGNPSVPSTNIADRFIDGDIIRKPLAANAKAVIGDDRPH